MVSSIRFIRSCVAGVVATLACGTAVASPADSIDVPDLLGDGLVSLKVAKDTRACGNSGCCSKNVLSTLLLPAP
ncbi:hypothetical protein D3C85_1680570 [compost metagenome]